MPENEQLNKPSPTEVQQQQEKINNELDTFLKGAEKDGSVKIFVEKIEKNQLVVDLILSEVENKINTMKDALSPVDKKVLAEMIWELGKEDARNTHINRDPTVYKDLIYQLMGGEKIDHEILDQEKGQYELLVGFADQVSNLCLEFLAKAGTGESTIVDPLLSEDISGQFTKKMTDVMTNFNTNIVNIKTIPEETKTKYGTWSKALEADIKNIFENSDKSSGWKQRKLNALIKDANKMVKDSYKDYNNARLDYDKQVLERDKSYAKLQFTESTTSSTETLANHGKEIRNFVKSNIASLQASVPENYRDMVMVKIDRFVATLDSTPDDQVASVVENGLQDAKKALGSYSFLLGKNPEEAVEALMIGIQKINAGESLDTNIKPLSWSELLKPGVDLKKYITEDKYIQVYNDMFDVMYKSGLSPISKMEFKGEKVNVIPDQIVAFKNMLVNKGIDTQASIELVYNTKTMNPNYPEGMRLVKVGTEYISAGSTDYINKELVHGLQDNIKNIKVDDLLSDIKVLDKSGGPEALKTLFDLQSTETLKYFTPASLSLFMKNVLTLPNQEDKRSYMLNLLVGIQGNKELVSQYFTSFKENIGSFNNDLVTKQLISNKFLELSQGSLFDPEDENDKKTMAEIAVLKATIDAQKLSDQPKSLEGQIQTLIKSGVGLLFNHPIGKMLMSFLDSLFGGKGGLKRMFGGIKGFNEELDREFKKQYGLKGEQQNIIKNLDSLSSLEPSFGDRKPTHDDKLITFVGNIQNTKDPEGYGNKIIEQFFTEKSLKNIGENNENSVLDVTLLNTYYLTHKDKVKDISYESLFTVNPDSKQVTFKEGINQEQISSLLKVMIGDAEIHKIIFDADKKLSGTTKNLLGKDKNIDLGNGDQKLGINTQVDYAKALAAYLMGGSKGDKFHYVLSENAIGSQTVEKPEPDEFDKKIDEIMRKNIVEGETCQGYTFKNPDIKYTYEDTSKIAGPKKDYQEGLLYPLAELFEIKDSPEKGSNFDRLLANKNNTSGNISDNKIFRDSYHLSNMMTFVNSGEQDTSKSLFSPDVVNAIKDMTKVQIDKQGLIFSKDGGSKVEITKSSKGLETKYTPRTSTQETPAVQKNATDTPVDPKKTEVTPTQNPEVKTPVA